MVVSYVAAVVVDTSVNFVIKNSYLYFALTNVRTSLQEVITELALPKLGSFLAGVVGSQLGTMCSIPVTLFLADMTTIAMKEMVRSVDDIFCNAVYGKEYPQFPPLWREMAFSVSSFAIGFFAKAYFCNYGMAYVAEALKYTIIVGAPFCGASVVISCLAPAIVVLAAPTVTFALGDVLAKVVSTGSYSAMELIVTSI